MPSNKSLCTRLKNLDKRYRTWKKCKFSMIDNLQNIDEVGNKKITSKRKISLISFLAVVK